MTDALEVYADRTGSTYRVLPGRRYILEDAPTCLRAIGNYDNEAEAVKELRRMAEEGGWKKVEAER